MRIARRESPLPPYHGRRRDGAPRQRRPIGLQSTAGEIKIAPSSLPRGGNCICGRSSMVERQLPKLHTRVRFPSPAPLSPGPESHCSPKPAIVNHRAPRRTLIAPELSAGTIALTQARTLRHLRMPSLAVLPCFRISTGSLHVDAGERDTCPPSFNLCRLLCLLACCARSGSVCFGKHRAILSSCRRKPLGRRPMVGIMSARDNEVRDMGRQTTSRPAMRAAYVG